MDQDPALQLAAALDKRGLNVSAHRGIVLVWIEGAPPMMITPYGKTTNDYGHNWSWHYAGATATHPRNDTPGAAQAVTQFLRTTFVLKEPPNGDGH
ncbi:MAG TPA: hypothetical protein VF933_21400 [Streptosporangiaceae bacterium]